MDEKNVWDIIADSWTNLNVKPERVVESYAKKLDVNKVLDVGCGNGRNLLPFLEKGCRCVGVDSSPMMIEQARRFLSRRGYTNTKLLVADARNLPFSNDEFDLVLFIRALHNIKGREERIKALKEARRVGKKLLLSVWKKFQRRFLFLLLRNFFSSDVYIPWNYHGKKLLRYYHLYTKKELMEDLKRAGWKLSELWEDEKGNIWCLCKK